MAEQSTEAEDGRDAAWVTVETPLPGAALLAFCREDVERLFRINSLLRFDAWRRLAANDHHVRLRNLSNERTLETDLHVEQLPDGLRVVYGDGLKSSTSFQVAETAGGSQLVVTDDYSGTPAAERRSRADEADRSLVQWGHDLHHYLARWSRWSRYAAWRWYMNRIWQPMTPAGRRVVFALVVISALEFFAFLAVLAIFVLELDRLL
ncbi:MAG: hypothetical protein OEN55_01710 [Alphaproteobacteria bacterium]|nr:hypothetical protein [Alphaproteobacteria bacterium]